MLDFNTPILSDKQWVEEIIFNSDVMGCENTFANTFLWRKKYDIRICRYNDFYFKTYFSGNKTTGYTFPVGKGDIKKAVDEIIVDAKQRNSELLIGLLTENTKELLNSLYPGMFIFKEDRDNFDYIYNQSDLALLAGRRYHSKRNHITNFIKKYPDYSYKSIDKSNFNDAYEVAKIWCQDNGCGAGIESELCAIKEAFENFFELDLFGGIVYVENKPAAMTVASKLNNDICDVHFEKSVNNINAYAVINRDFSASVPQFKYLNREEDMGIEGLRKAKLSYKPEILLNKYTATLVK